MTLVQLNRPVSKNFNQLFEDFFNDFTTTPGQGFASDRYKNNVPVNITENKDGYVISMLVPGFDKSELKIDMDKGILTISAERKEEAANEQERSVRKEFTLSSFKRSFTLDEKINADGIQAKYENGVLALNLPRKEEVKPQAKQIAIH